MKHKFDENLTKNPFAIVNAKMAAGLLDDTTRHSSVLADAFWRGVDDPNHPEIVLEVEVTDGLVAAQRQFTTAELKDGWVASRMRWLWDDLLKKKSDELMSRLVLSSGNDEENE